MTRRMYVDLGMLGVAIVAATRSMARMAEAVAATEKIETHVVLNPEEPEVREPPRPRRGYEKFKMDPRNTRMKMKARR